MTDEGRGIEVPAAAQRRIISIQMSPLTLLTIRCSSLSCANHFDRLELEPTRSLTHSLARSLTHISHILTKKSAYPSIHPSILLVTLLFSHSFIPIPINSFHPSVALPFRTQYSIHYRSSSIYLYPSIHLS